MRLERGRTQQRGLAAALLALPELSHWLNAMPAAHDGGFGSLMRRRYGRGALALRGPEARERDVVVVGPRILAEDHEYGAQVG